MKKLFNVAFLAILAICFTSCDKEQSSFDVNDIKTTAKIFGTISYNLGQDYRDGAYINNIQPAANKKVYVEVANSSLSPNSLAAGVTIYETTTNENGEYSIDIPAVPKGTQATVSAEKFIAKFKEVVSVNNGTPVYDETEALFSVTPNEYTLKPNDIVIGDAKYSSDKRDEQNEYPYNSTFIVKVGTPQYNIATVNGYKQITMTYAAKGDANVIVTIDGKKYGATTNSEGAATFTIPAKQKKWTANATIEVEPYAVTDFKYYDSSYTNNYGDYELKEIKSGIMSNLYPNNSETIAFTGIVNDKKPILTIPLGFRPHDDVDKFNYNINSWNYIDVEF